MRIIYILQMHFVNHIEICTENKTIQNGIDQQLLYFVSLFRTRQIQIPKHLVHKEI